MKYFPWQKKKCLAVWCNLIITSVLIYFFWVHRRWGLWKQKDLRLTKYRTESIGAVQNHWSKKSNLSPASYRNFPWDPVPNHWHWNQTERTVRLCIPLFTDHSCTGRQTQKTISRTLHSCCPSPLFRSGHGRGSMPVLDRKEGRDYRLSILMKIAVRRNTRWWKGKILIKSFRIFLPVCMTFFSAVSAIKIWTAFTNETLPLASLES